MARSPFVLKDCFSCAGVSCVCVNSFNVGCVFTGKCDLNDFRTFSNGTSPVYEKRLPALI